MSTVFPPLAEYSVHAPDRRHSGWRRVMRVPGLWNLQHREVVDDQIAAGVDEIRRRSGAVRTWTLGLIHIAEYQRLRTRLGTAGRAELLDQVCAQAVRPLRWRGAMTGQGGAGELVVMLPATAGRSAESAFAEMALGIAGTDFVVAGERLRVTPVPGYARLDDTDDAGTVLGHARLAVEVAAGQLDVVPVAYDPRMQARAGRRARRRPLRARLLPSTPVQVLLSTLLCLGVPYGAYTVSYQLGYDLTPLVFGILVVALVSTALTIYLEQLAALEPEKYPGTAAAPPPPASAVIAAYLPNESATIVDTVEAFLRLDYPGPLQIILAYNTPHRLPVEDVLERIAARDPRFVPLRVPDSTSKAQNVNAAISVVTGEFVGVFDADHHPAPDAFVRAWTWLSNGWAVVQGHCVVRNGETSWISRTVAVEFETIYAVSHPGRAKLHGFGIFGGSNGYWRTDLLHQTRMRGSMLTEDIDASLRTLMAGGRIVCDPALISYELAPTTLSALWRQRMRWAQGWTQVSHRHLWKAIWSRSLSTRQKFGLAWLLGWREIYPWLSPQIYPLLVFTLLHPGPGDGVAINVPLYLLSCVFATMVGPMQALFAYALADPTIRAHRGWFIRFCLMNIAYSELKNVIARLAPVKELLQERAWHITPRQVGTPTGPGDVAAATGFLPPAAGLAPPGSSMPAGTPMPSGRPVPAGGAGWGASAPWQREPI